jgi:hypothetical protein
LWCGRFLFPTMPWHWRWPCCMYWLRSVCWWK